MPLKDPIAKVVWQKKWYQDNREKELKKQKQYYKDHRKERAVYDKQKYQDHREEKLAYANQYTKKHRKEKAVYDKQYHKKTYPYSKKKARQKEDYQDHREEKLANSKQYNKDNPEVTLRAQKKLYKKMGLTKYQIQAWTKVIRKGKNCSHCDSDKDLHSHHIFPKSKYNDLALNENNGVVLCDPCHKEHHILNGIN